MRRAALMRLVLANILVILLFTVTTLPQAFADPPNRVGRVSVVDGALTVTTLDSTLPQLAPVNYPVAAGMRFSTAAGTRSELELGNLTTRLDGRTGLEIAGLDDDAVALRLNGGSIDVRVRILFEGEHITVTTGDGEISLTEPGAYRIDAPNGSRDMSDVTHLEVFTGQARVISRHGHDDVFAGEAVDVNGDSGSMRYSQASPTWLDDWAASREQETANIDTDRYVDPEMAGAGDLDRAGTWDETPDYGAVWYPADVPVDWEPYRYGTWAWVAPWGWTWIDDRPWGFTPFHYGRWVRTGNRWGWWPGEHRRHPAYAPAIVGFSGNGTPSRHIRPHAWVPLAPGEAYRPPYPHNDAYAHNINLGIRPQPGGRRWNGRDDDHERRPPNTNFVNGGDAISTVQHQPQTGAHDGWRGDGWRGDGWRGHQPDGSRRDNAPITVTNDTFRRQHGGGNFTSPPPVAGGAQEATSTGFVTPPPATPSTPPAPITPMTTSPAGSYQRPGRGDWRNDSRLDRGFQNPTPADVNPADRFQTSPAPQAPHNNWTHPGEWPDHRQPAATMMQTPTAPTAVQVPHAAMPEPSQSQPRMPSAQTPAMPPAPTGIPPGMSFAGLPHPTNAMPQSQPMVAPTPAQPAQFVPMQALRAAQNPAGGRMHFESLGVGNTGQGNVGQGNTGGH